MADIYQAISRTVIGLLIDEPFFAHLLGSIPREISDRTQTVGLELNSFGPRLLINEQYYLKTLRSESQRRAVIKHEALHVAFSHFCRGAGTQIKDLLDIASDLVVNQFVRASSLPNDAVTLATFPQLKLKPNDTLENYYTALSKHYTPDMSQSGESSNRRGAGGTSAGDAEGSDKGRKGTGGKKGKRKSEATEETLRKTLQQSRHGDHQYWGTADKATAYAVEDLLIRARQRTPIKDWGTIPGPIGDLINMILEQRKPQVDWKRQLRLFGASSRRTRVVHTIRRVSKRYGTRPGIKIKRFQKLLVAIDTSGSIDTDALELFFSEVRGMWRNGAEVMVVECDCDVQRIYSYRGNTPDVISGGGGTDFDPVFQYAKSNRNLQFDGIIYLTDGYAETPTVRPTCRVLWVITPDGTKENIAYGPAIELT
ncbi:VWA-like domain-containing protein [Pirellulaceae bacterium]|nr:VWA-like domain-containing protein [Pirellulaceae bacterium]